jgi:hypothetical protein
MCLQWCHATHQLIDNDIACTHCVLSGALRPDQCCDTCCHRVERDGKPPMCRLTSMGLPLSGGCCHANIVPDTPDDGIMWLDTDDVAPSALAHHRVATIAALFEHSPTAPNYTATVDGGVEVNIENLARPEIYGVPAPDWDEALGRERPQFVWTEAAEAIATGPRYSDTVMPLIDAISAALESDDLTLERRAELLAAARALPPLPVPWDEIIKDAIEILEEPTT